MPSIHITLPKREWYTLPDPEPATLQPPPPTGTLRAPFAIPASWFNAALSPLVPVTIAVVYFTTVFLLNSFNRNRGNKAWRISKTKPFFWLVVAHNVFLALYSAVTFVAMFRALSRTLPSIGGAGDVVSSIDALCQIQGPRGLGDAVSYDPASGKWGVNNPRILMEGGLPDRTDVGRLWNEGLAFWGWFFYLSKFYEVIDTLIILAKGKRSSTLQTYHHAGAMLCMWAGIRYMSPPIWMFVFVNSGIHALMYTYYTVAAFGVRVPQRLKRTLTTMQILQFVVGTLFAACHLFISYTVSVPTPYTFLHNVTRVVSSVVAEATSAAPSSASPIANSASSAVTAAASSASSVAALGAFGNMLKQVAWRAAGEQGIAENIDGPVQSAGVHNLGNVIQSVVGHVETAAAAVESVVEPRGETVWRDELRRVRCIDTTGQAFAINLNIFYLLPLTYLFGRFFYRSYILPKLTGKPAVSSKSGRGKRRESSFLEATRDAVNATRREVENFGKNVEDDVAEVGEKVEEAIEDVDGDASEQNGKELQEAGKELKERAMNGVKNLQERGRKMVKDAVVNGEMHEDGKDTNGSLNGEPKSNEKDEDGSMDMGDDSNKENEGLSTADPHDTGVSYADKMK